ncbi:MAG: C40 family peptidase [Patescibacteria group bacterium]|nr:C40 family peptidase [Patescibacteria group bacterium]
MAEKHKAFFAKPIVNLLSHKLSDSPGFERFSTTYSPESKNSCLRTFQGLFGEMVFVEDQEEQDGYVRVEMCTCFFADKILGKRPLFYWAKRRDLIFFEELTDIERALFPEPIFYQYPESVVASNVVTLVAPWSCKKNGQTYSVGTRFITIAADVTRRLQTITFFDPVSRQQLVVDIPLRFLVNQGLPIPDEGRKKLFVKLLKKWSRKRRGIIPYIWGGASYVSRTKNENFMLKEDMVGEQKVAYWTREDGKPEPDGFDCSGLVLRAAQASGIGYFCRTAGTAGAVLMPLSPEQSIDVGDLFVTEGHNHIFVAAGHNAIIEAAGYSSGFASVHQIPIKDRFANAKNYADMLMLYILRKVPIYRCKDGKYVTPTSFTIVRLPG